MPPASGGHRVCCLELGLGSPYPRAQIVHVDQFLVCYQLGILRKRNLWRKLPRTIRVLGPHRFLSSLMKMMKVAAGCTASATASQQVAARAVRHVLWIGIPLTKHPELRTDNYVCKVIGQKIEGRFEVVEVDARADMYFSIRSN